jgi:AraC family transcriptional regulator, regulatory protein of adaptative response / methylated-DNA-[protein]-cysteine methyltransferase
MRAVSVSPVLIGSDGVSETRSGDLHPWLDPMVCNRARLARDAWFDGRFFTGVLTTRIYCRPICPVRPARSEHVHFFPSAAAAEQAGFRPCLRCRPELEPGLPTLSGATAAVSRAIDLIHRGFLDERHVEDLGAAVGIGARHLTRLFVRYHGAPPRNSPNGHSSRSISGFELR